MPLADLPWGSWRRRVGSQFTLVRDLPCGPSSFQQPSASLLQQPGLTHSFACSLLFLESLPPSPHQPSEPGERQLTQLPVFLSFFSKAVASAPWTLGIGTSIKSCLLCWDHCGYFLGPPIRYCKLLLMQESSQMLVKWRSSCWCLLSRFMTWSARLREKSEVSRFPVAE